MKKIIAVLILTAIMLSSLLTIVPIAAEEATTEKNNVLYNPRNDQMAGKGPAFYYDFHLFDFDIGQYPMNEVVKPDGSIGYQGTRPYMLRSKNAASGSATPIDGLFDTYTTAYNSFGADDALAVVTDKDGNTYDFDAWLGISIRDTAVVDSFAFYTVNETTRGDKLLIEELTLFGAVVDPTLHTYAPNSWFRMTDTIKNVQATSTADGKYAVVTGDLYMPYEVDYLFLAFNIEGDGGGDYVCVEIELYEDSDSYIDIEDLNTSLLTETLALAETALANEKGYTADSFAALSVAYERAKIIASKDRTNQKAIDNVTTGLYEAIVALVPVADASELIAALDSYKDLVAADYTTSSWNTFATARDAATTLINSGNVSEASITENLAALKGAAEGLELKATAEMIAAIKAKVEEAGALDADLYTTKTITALRVTMRDANIITNGDLDNISVKQYEAAIKTIDDAIAALKEKADFAALQAVLDEATAIDAKAYTAASYEALATAIADMTAFLAGNEDNATFEEGDALSAALNAAKAALVKLGDFTALDAKIAELEALVSTEYTAESWKALTDAIAAAKALNKADATQADVDAALAAITVAADALAKPAATDDVTEPAAQSGCGGVVSVSTVVLVATLGFGVTVLKRK